MFSIEGKLLQHVVDIATIPCRLCCYSANHFSISFSNRAFSALDFVQFILIQAAHSLHILHLMNAKCIYCVKIPQKAKLIAEND